MNIISLAVAAIIVIGAALSPNVAQSQNTSNCTSSIYNPYSLLCTLYSTYERGDTVSFWLRQSKTPIFIGPEERPWAIFDANGNEIYRPPSIPPTEMPEPRFVYQDSWDQIDNQGKQVHKGKYYLYIFSTSYNNPPLEFTIVNNLK